MLLRKALLCFLLVVLVSFPSFSLAQSKEAETPRVRNPNLPELYLHLLRWQNHLDAVADDRAHHGRNSAWLRGYLQKQLAFTDAEFVPIRDSAHRLQMTDASLHERAKALITSDLALYRAGKLQSSDRPPNLDRVRDLEQQRNAAIAAEIQDLNSKLGPTNAARLEKFVTNSFSKNVVVKRSPVPSQRHREFGPSREALGMGATK